jgi:hypothetical protein
MTETLRPSTLGEILDRTAQLYRRNFWLFTGTAAMPLILAFLLAIPALGIFAIPGIAGSGGNPVTLIRGVAFVFAFLLFTPVYIALYVFAIACITQAAVTTHRGDKLTIRASLKMVRPRFWTYLWYLIVQSIMAVFVPMILAGVVIGPLIYLIAQPGVGTATSVALGFVVFVVGAAAIGVIVWLLLSYSMGMAVCVVEKKTAWESLMRAMQLSKGTRGCIFVLFLLVMVLSIAVSTISYIFAMLAGAVAAVMGTGSTAAIVAAVVGGVLYAVMSISAQIVLQPISRIALVLFYYDQRIRTEGYDIEWMMERAGLTQAPATTLLREGGTISAPAAPPDTPS